MRKFCVDMLKCHCSSKFVLRHAAYMYYFVRVMITLQKNHFIYAATSRNYHDYFLLA